MVDRDPDSRDPDDAVFVDYNGNPVGVTRKAAEEHGWEYDEWEDVFGDENN